MTAITNAVYADRLADILDAFATGTSAGDVEYLAAQLLDLANDWTLEGLSLPQLAATFSGALGNWNQFLEGMVDWFTLPADGGDLADGNITVLSYTGVEYTIPVLAKVQDVATIAEDALANIALLEGYKDDAEAAATAAAVSSSSASGFADAADASATAAAGSAASVSGEAAAAAASAAAALASETAAAASETATAADVILTAADVVSAAAARDAAEVFRDEAEGFRDEASAIVGGDFQPHDAMLDSLVAKTWAAGRQALILTAADTLALATIGAGGGTELLDRDAGDGRYATPTDVSGALAALTPADLSLEIGTDVQAWSSTLDDLTAAAPGEDEFVYWAGTAGAVAAPLSAFARSVLDDADAAAARQTLGVLETFTVALSDQTTAISATGQRESWRAPYAAELVAVRASLKTASTSGAFVIDIKEAGASILSTKLSIDQDEKTSTSAATPAVISDATLADDAELTFYIDSAGASAVGAKVTLTLRRL